MAKGERSSQPIWIGEDQRGFNHFRVHMDVLKHSGMGVYEFAVYCGLVAHAEVQTGEARPSAATLARYFGAGERRIREAVTWLEDHHWIRVERTNGKASHYYVLPPPSAARGAGVKGDSAAPQTGVPRHVVPGTAARGADELEPENKNPSTSARAEVESQFSYLWDAYPARDGKKVGKAKALEQFSKLSLEDRRASLRGARNLARAIADGGRFGVPDAHRFLRDRTFDDWQTPADVRHTRNGRFALSDADTGDLQPDNKIVLIDGIPMPAPPDA